MQEFTLLDLNDDQKKEIIKFKDKGASNDQLKEYALALIYNIDTTLYTPELSTAQLRELRLGDLDNIDMTPYLSFDAQKMKEIRYGLKCSKYDGRDIVKYKDYSLEQIKTINDLYNQGLLPEYFSWLDDISYSPALMIAIFEVIKSGKIFSKEELQIYSNLSDAENIRNLKNLLNDDNSNSEVSTEVEEELFEEYDEDSDDDLTEFIF